MIRYQKKKWSADVLEQLLNGTLSTSAIYELKGQVCRKKAELWHVSGGGCDGFLVTRAEAFGQWREMVLAVAVGRGLHAAWPGVPRLLERGDCQSARIHTEKRGIVRMMRKYGFYPVQQENGFWILRKYL